MVLARSLGRVAVFGFLCRAARAGWSGHRGDFPESGEDFGEQIVAGWGSEGELAGVVDQAGGDADQPAAGR